MVKLTDTHCHLNFNLFKDDLEDTLKRAWEIGIERILIPGTDIETSQQAVRLCEKHPQLFASIGVHPNDALTWKKETLGILTTLANNPKVVAIGEIGLDFYRDNAPHELQIEIFQKQLELASGLNLPVIIHSRQSFLEVWKIVNCWYQNLKPNSKLFLAPGVFHSFEGTTDEALKAISNNFFIGASGPVTFNNANERQKTISQIPLVSLLLETDSPFLTPEPFRGKRNEPAYTIFIAEKISQLKNIALPEILEITSNNARNLFGWGVI